MSHLVNVNDVRSRIRQEFDIETSAESTAQFPNALLETWIDAAYRAMFDLVAPRCGLERFGVQTTLTAPTFTLPTELFHVLGIDMADGGSTVALEPWSYAERNQWDDATRPRWRVVSGALVWKPQAPTSSVTLWHVPRPTTLAAGGSFDAINGWDDYVVLWVGRKVRTRQEYDLTEVVLQLNEAERRVKDSASRLRTPTQVGDARTEHDSAYYNS